MKMKKSVMVLLGLIFVVLLTGSVFAEEVAYVYKIKAKISQEIKDVFEDRGFDVVEIADKDVGNYDLSRYKLVLIGDECLNRELDVVEIWKYPSIIMNKFYGTEWGFTDDEGVSQMTANYPLSVFDDGDITQVYTSAIFTGQVKTNIPYYFLADDNIAPGLDTVVETYSGSGQYQDDEIGSVIAFGSVGDDLLNGEQLEAKMCFFGIAKTEYWTEDARELFEECVGSVLIECQRDSDCDDDEDSTVDTCKNPGEPDSYCDYEDIPCSRDSDCGDDGFVGDVFCQSDNVFKTFREWTCVNAGDSDSYCDKDDENQLVQSCPDVCIDGECLDVPCSSNADCDDSNSYTMDICKNPGRVDSYCEYVDVACVSNSDCDDEDVRTEDECVNAGTNEAFCRNTEVNCLNDADCGFTGFSGNEFCSRNNIFKNFQVSSCINPGTLDSWCVIEISSTKVQDCSDQNGDTIDECVTIDGSATCQNLVPPCITDADCADGDSHTKDICVNAGSLNSYCDYRDVICNNDVDCGVDSFVGGGFCSGDNIFQLHRDYDCVNAGSTNSYCASEDESRLVESCGSNYCGDWDMSCKEGNVYKIRSCVDRGCDSASCVADSRLDEQLVQVCQHGCNDGSCLTECTPGEINSCSTGQQGVCSDGMKVCSSQGNWGSCIRNTEPSIEMCDQLDNDCDGQIDEGGVCNIECSSDNDCGVDEWIGDTTCMEDDVFQNFKVFTCRESGTYDSYCVDQIDLIIKEQCSDTCFEGECVEIECYDDGDCDDYDSTTIDSCVSPGTVDSYCNYRDTECSDGLDNDADGFVDSNDPGCHSDGNPGNGLSYEPGDDSESDSGIDCFIDTDCGIDQWVGDVLCDGLSGDDVYQNFKVFTCRNPGTLTSYCTDQVDLILKNQCSDGCEDGVCRECISFDSFSCDDNDVFWFDSCDRRGDMKEECGEDSCEDWNTECRDDDVWRERMCGVNGCEGDSCVSSVFLEDELLEECEFLCENGGCVGECVPGTTDIMDMVCGVGSCVRSGTKTRMCDDDGVWGGWIGSCTPGSPTAEVCDGIDNDCDGQVDEGGVCNVDCNVDSDCGVDQWIGDVLCDGPLGDDVYQNFKVFTCRNPGEYDSYCTDQVDLLLKEQCADICVNGGCVDVVCYDKDDCGIDMFIGDEFCQSDDVFQLFRTWECLNAGTSDSVCSFGDDPELIEECNYVCAGGECGGVCEPGATENRGISCGVGSCARTGTETRSCNSNGEWGSWSGTCTPGSPTAEVCDGIDNDCDGQVDEGGVCNVDCNVDSDCGVDQWVGDVLCDGPLGDDVYQNFKVFTCRNPGEYDSYCTDQVDLLLKEQCADICVEGGCVDVECFQDSDCGISGFTGNNFCQNEDIFRATKTWECLNAGTENAACSSLSGQSLIEDCGEDSTGAWDEFCHSDDVYRSRNLIDKGCTNALCFEDTNVEEELVEDCGVDSCGSWSNFCEGDDVYRERTCYDRGCNNDNCFENSNVENELVEVCDFVCANGVCGGVCEPGTSENRGINCGVGSCARTGTETRTCNSNGQWGSWSGSCVAGNPGTETCNNIDDDCDGVVDESLSESHATSCGVGFCAATGTKTRTCSAGNWGSWSGSCVAGNPGTETCNNIDDDCDGVVDEGLSESRGISCGVGECGRTGTETRTCSTGSWGSWSGTCTPGSPTSETCDNLDNDCDGQIDWFVEYGTTSCGVGGCARTGTKDRNCQSGVWSQWYEHCTAGSPGVESCNSVDDDCDGSVDEGLGVAFSKVWEADVEFLDAGSSPRQVPGVQPAKYNCQVTIERWANGVFTGHSSKGSDAEWVDVGLESSMWQRILDPQWQWHDNRLQSSCSCSWFTTTGQLNGCDSKREIKYFNNINIDAIANLRHRVGDSLCVKWEKISCTPVCATSSG